MSIDLIVSEASNRLKRKVEILDLKNKSQMTSAEVRKEMASMRNECEKVSSVWPRKEDLGAKLLEKLQSSSCTERDVVGALIQGAPVNTALDPLGRTALHWACQQDNVTIASTLLDFGANANATDSTNTLPLHVVAAVSRNGVMAELIVEMSQGVLLSQNCNGWTALHVAAFIGNELMVRLLLSQSGMDTSIRDSEGATCLHAAVGAAQVECVRLLISMGANVNAKTSVGDTPLHFASRMGNGQLVTLLLKAGADRTQKNHANISCLAGGPEIGQFVKQADEAIAAHATTDADLPLKMDIGPQVPEARSHHFIVDAKAVEAVSNTFVTFSLRTSPPRLGLRFVTQCESSFGAKVTYGWTMDHRTGCYSVTYLHPSDEKAQITVALVEGGEVVAKRGFKVASVTPRVVGRFCSASGPGLYAPKPGANHFTVQLRNQCGTDCHTGGVQGLSVVVQKPNEAARSDVATLQDHGNGLYTVKFDLPASGIVSVDTRFQGQSIVGFPVKLDMDTAAKLASFFNARKMDEDIAYYRKKLASVDSSAESSALGRNRKQQRLCVSCAQREVCALVLPCRHFRYCASCASGNVVLGTPCKVCQSDSKGYLVVKNQGGI